MSTLLLALLVPVARAQAVDTLRPEVALLGATVDPSWTECASESLWCTNEFDVVDVLDVASATPTVDDLARYDAVLLYADAAYADPIALGDALFHYVEGGGGLVLAVGPLCGGITTIEGLLVSQGLMPVAPGTISAPGGGSLVIAPEFAWLPGPIDGHDAIYGFNTFQGGDGTRCAGLAPTSQADVLATWDDGEPLVVALEPPEPQFGRVAAVNFLPPGDACRVGGWATNTDGDRAMSSALLWSMRYEKPPGTVFNEDMTQDLNCNGLDVADEPTIDVTVDDACEDLVGPDGLPIDNNDWYFDFFSHACDYPVDTLDADGDLLGGGTVTIPGQGSFPDQQASLVCDNCPDDYNPDQADIDDDGIGDLCDNCIYENDPLALNLDADHFGDLCDNCVLVPNNLQTDADFDAIGDACDNCDVVVNPDQADCDRDGVGDACDNCVIVTTCQVEWDPRSPNPDQYDVDGDGIGDSCDNCPTTFSEDLSDSDGDGVGDACDNCPGLATDDTVDQDGDGVGDACDVCPFVVDRDQADSDLDEVGDACDNCFVRSNRDQADLDADGLGDLCDICPEGQDPGQADTDGDGLGDACDVCPTVADAGQDDRDLDGWGDACDFCVYDPSGPADGNLDSDADGVGDLCDNCPRHGNPLQQDGDSDDIGDACDLLGLRGGGALGPDIRQLGSGCDSVGGAGGWWVLAALGVLGRRRR